MHCIILFPDSAGRLPAAEELRQRGFAMSAAVLLPGPPLAREGVAPGHAASENRTQALAAEASAPYGRRGRLEP